MFNRATAKELLQQYQSNLNTLSRELTMQNIDPTPLTQAVNQLQTTLEHDLSGLEQVNKASQDLCQLTSKLSTLTDIKKADNSTLSQFAATVQKQYGGVMAQAPTPGKGLTTTTEHTPMPTGPSSTAPAA